MRQHIDNWGKERDTVVVSFSRTMHTYLNILKQIAELFKLDAPVGQLEKEIIQAAYHHIRERKTLYTLIEDLPCSSMTSRFAVPS